MLFRQKSCHEWKNRRSRLPQREYLPSGRRSKTFGNRDCRDDLVVPSKRPTGTGYGDRTTGKTHALMQMVTCRQNSGTICIWAAIGKRKSDIKGVEAFLKSQRRTQNTLIVATDSYARREKSINALHRPWPMRIFPWPRRDVSSF